MQNSKIRRISYELDEQIQKIMKKNSIKYIDASKEIAKLTDKLNGKKIFKEIKF